MNYPDSAATPASTATQLSSAPGYLPAGLPIPVPENDGLSKPYWDGLRAGQLLVQRCTGCGTLRFGPEWICHQCHGFGYDWEAQTPSGTVYSWERVWHPVHPRLRERGPYLVVLVELAGTPGLRMIGNLLGDAMQEVRIGSRVKGVFEQHADAEPPYALLQWQVDEGA